MKCEPCTYSQESAEDSSQTLSSAMTQSSLWSGIPTPAKSSKNAPPKDGSPICQCGKEMSDCSIHPSTPEEWIASMRDSLVRTLALPGIKRALDMRHDPAYIEKSSVLLASFDPVTCSLKTSQQSLVTDSEPYSQTLPRWGSLRNGDVSEHPIAAHRITGIGGSYWPTVGVRGFTNEGDLMALGKKCETFEEMSGMAYRAALKKKQQYFPTPTVTSGAQVAWDKTPGQTGGTTLAGYVKYWPTPTAHLAKETNAPSEANRNEPTLSSLVGGTLNPSWVEWLMGFPIEFTASKGWGTPKSRCKLRLPGSYLEANK